MNEDYASITMTARVFDRFLLESNDSGASVAVVDWDVAPDIEQQSEAVIRLDLGTDSDMLVMGREILHRYLILHALDRPSGYLKPIAVDAQEFARLATAWKRETSHLSLAEMIAEHPAYQEIIAMGSTALPFILKDLKETGGQWFWALRAITGSSPVRPKDRGNIEAITESWLNWGRANRYI